MNINDLKRALFNIIDLTDFCGVVWLDLAKEILTVALWAWFWWLVIR